MKMSNAELIATARLRGEKYSSGSDEYLLNQLIAALEAAEAQRGAARDRADRWQDRCYKALERFDVRQHELAVEAAGLQVAAEVPICPDGDHDWLDFNNAQGFMVCAECGLQAEDPDPDLGKAGE